MGTESGGSSIKKKANKRHRTSDGTSDWSDEEQPNFAPYRKINHIRNYPENSGNVSFAVFLESIKEEEKLGNKSPIYMNNIFSRYIKGVKQIKRINANKYAAIFDNAKNANALLNNTNFLKIHEMKAYIPASIAESIGVIRFVPTDLSNKHLFNKLVSSQEILGVRRFMKKTGEGILPLQTVSVTFAGNILPEYVTYELCALRVEPYIRPVIQCFKCLNFGHMSKFCKKMTVCSICGQSHSYKECENIDNPFCVNCKGNHVALSKSCPIKMKKIEENKQKIMHKTSIHSQFPLLNKPSFSKTVNTHIAKESKNDKELMIEFINNNAMMNAFIKTFTTLIHKDNKLPVNSKTIKELFIENINS